MKFTRRSFLATSGLIATGTALGMTPSLKNEQEIRVGIIGTGVRGQELASSIRNISNMKTIACCDVIPFRLKDGISKAGPDAKSYTDYRKLLEDKSVNAVIISTPFSMHGQMALDAIDAGKHVFCEKTMVKGIDDIQKVVKKANSNKLIFQTGHQYHSSRLYVKVVEMIKEGVIGDVSAFECQWNRNTTWRRIVPEPKWERLINWRMYDEYSGGLVAELNSHQIDFVNWVLDAHPQKVVGMGGIDYYKDGRETFDNTHLIFDYPSGVRAKFTCLTTNRFQNYMIKVLGKKGTIILDLDKAVLFAENDAAGYDGVDGVSSATMKIWEQGTPIDVQRLDPTLQALTDFGDAIRNQTKPLSDVKSGAITSICVEMGNQAMKNERIEYWQEKYNI